MTRTTLSSGLVLTVLGWLVLGAPGARAAPDELWRQVEILRTAHGVPHVRANNLRAAGYALAWLQSEDYGTRTAMAVLAARGQLATISGRESIESDFGARHSHARAVRTYHRLQDDTRDVYEGFAAGLNRYIALHGDEFSPYMPADFSGYDIAALDVHGPPAATVRAFLATIAKGTPQSSDGAAGLPPSPIALPRRYGGPAQPRAPRVVGEAGQAGRLPADLKVGASDSENGSNAWAFAPSHTKSRKAILLRNPHLAWTSGYYEAHLTVPGVVDFYGDFRIGGPFVVVGGFNRDLGWATTNNALNSERPSEIYALALDPGAPDRYLLNGASLPLEREMVTAEFRQGDALKTETREVWSTPIGQVIHRTADKVYIIKAAGDDEFRGGEQYLRMMRASSLGAWQDAMKMRALSSSNFTYADRAGNIFYLWNAALPLLPHPIDTVAVVDAGNLHDVWTRYVPFEALPQLLNPPGGYIHNENNSPHFTNVRRPIDLTNTYPNFEEPDLSLRAQLGLELASRNSKVSLEDVVTLKHSYRMVLAERVKPDLMAAVRSHNPTGDVAAALKLLEQWTNTAAPDSRGSALFEVWWQRYAVAVRPGAGAAKPEDLFAHVWSVTDPLKTPAGLVNRDRAADAFVAAVEETTRRYGRWDVAWGDVHRVRQGSVDVPVGGCSSALGCFRALTFARDPDGKLRATGGDGWVLAVEFGDTPRAYSVLAYGESPRAESPWHADQAEMFARGEMKTVAFTQRDVEAQAVIRYRPGEK